jgi:hypothetical protein
MRERCRERRGWNWLARLDVNSSKRRQKPRLTSNDSSPTSFECYEAHGRMDPSQGHHRQHRERRRKQTDVSFCKVAVLEISCHRLCRAPVLPTLPCSLVRDGSYVSIYGFPSSSLFPFFSFSSSGASRRTRFIPHFGEFTSVRFRVMDIFQHDAHGIISSAITLDHSMYHLVKGADHHLLCHSSVRKLLQCSESR